MAIERAHARAVQKTWGSLDLRPWSAIPSDGIPIGEIWFERPDGDTSRSPLLLKVLVTRQNLSIQVHPDDSYARSIGLPWGKTEAWYILSAEPGAKVAVGLKKQVTSLQLRKAIDDGTIADLIRWQPVVQDDVVFVPAGTVHAIGPGLVVAEIQQRSDATFRMFDYGRGRELHVTDAIAVASAGPAKAPVPRTQYSNTRTLLIVDPHFVFERIDLMPASSWDFRAERETWLLVLRGGAKMGPLDVSVADAVLVDGEPVRIDASVRGLTCLVAYPGPRPVSDLLRVVGIPAPDAANSRMAHSASQPSARAASPLPTQEAQL